MIYLIDQRSSMFFGTRRAMKSVVAAETVALGAWRNLDQGDRVGGIVFGDEGLREFRPGRSRESVMRLLTEVTPLALTSAEETTEQSPNRNLKRVAHKSCTHD